MPRSAAQQAAFAALLPKTDLYPTVESRVNPAYVGQRFAYAGQGVSWVTNEGYVPFGSDWIGEYVRSLRTSEGEVWLELRLVEQGPGTKARIGSVYSLPAKQCQRQPAQLDD
jgi:hypothetical protein